MTSPFRLPPMNATLVSTDTAAVEARVLAALALLPKRTERVCQKVRMNRDAYRQLKAHLFMAAHSVGSPKTDEGARHFMGIQVEVDDSLTEVQYLDQHGERMYPQR